jgi:enoyl-CoA hydratase/carnithine racemase
MIARMPQLHRDGPVWIIDFGADENRYSPDFLDQVEVFLDELVADREPAALVTTATGKFFSNGLDLAWVQAHPEQFLTYVHRVERLLARLLTLPVPTVAAINGHAFGAGALVALCHDYRLMRDDRGFFCLPEVDIRIPFSVGMSALVQSKLTPRSAVDAMTTGRRYGGADALAAGVVDAVHSEDELLPAAIALATSLAGKDRMTLGTIKERMFAHVTAPLLQGAAG